MPTRSKVIKPESHSAHRARLVAVVGRANVGKSTLFNRLVGKPLAVTSEIAGTTRDRVSADVDWQGHSFTLVDTGGLDVGKSLLEQKVIEQAEIAIAEADVILFVVDIREGVLATDQSVARRLHKSNKPVLLVTQKADQRSAWSQAEDFRTLGLGSPYLVSGVTGMGTGDLLDAIVEKLPRLEKTDTPRATTFAFVGRPNVGKSSLVNALIGMEKTIVSEIPGTTRDTTSSLLEREGKQYLLLDTAGIIRPGKRERLERYAALRTLRTLREADVCLFLLDANVRLTAADKRVARHVLDARRPTIIVANKIDLVDEKNHEQLLKHISAGLPLLDWAPLITVSALEKTGLDEIFTQADIAQANFKRNIPEEELELFVQKNIAPHFIARAKGSISAKLETIRQVSVMPPRFALYVNDPRAVHFSYLRFVENRLRSRFDFTGSPLQILVKKSRLDRL
jgi:GTP-binding protein